MILSWLRLFLLFSWLSFFLSQLLLAPLQRSSITSSKGFVSTWGLGITYCVILWSSGLLTQLFSLSTKSLLSPISFSISSSSSSLWTSDLLTLCWNFLILFWSWEKMFNFLFLWTLLFFPWISLGRDENDSSSFFIRAELWVNPLNDFCFGRIVGLTIAVFLISFLMSSWSVLALVFEFIWPCKFATLILCHLHLDFV